MEDHQSINNRSTIVSQFFIFRTTKGLNILLSRAISYIMYNISSYSHSLSNIFSLSFHVSNRSIFLSKINLLSFIINIIHLQLSLLRKITNRFVINLKAIPHLAIGLAKVTTLILM